MYQDTVFEKALTESKEEELCALKADISGVENLIENLFSQILESTSVISERDFNICGI